MSQLPVQYSSKPLRDFKDSVRCATALPLPANTRTNNKLIAGGVGAFAAVDGVTLTTDGAAGLDNGTEAGSEYILVKDEVLGANNGIYYLSDPGDGVNPWVLTRRSDFDSDVEVTASCLVLVEEGTLYLDKGFQLSTNNPITLNTTPLTWIELSNLIPVENAGNPNGVVTGRLGLYCRDTANLNNYICVDSPSGTHWDVI